MRHDDDLDSDAKAFAEKFEIGFDHMRRQKGECPGTQRLIQFHYQELSGRDATGMEEHIQRCVACRSLLEAMTRFDEAPVSLPPDEWSAAEQRMTSQLEAALKN